MIELEQFRYEAGKGRGCLPPPPKNPPPMPKIEPAPKMVALGKNATLTEMLDYIQYHTTPVVRYEQLAEECCELAKAALKMNRAFGHTNNPTDKTKHEALAEFLEEFHDVLLLLKLHFAIETSADEQLTDKARRWVERIWKQNADE